MFCKNKTKALYRSGEQFDGQFISLALAQLTRIRPTNSNQCIQTHSDTFKHIQIHSDDSQKKFGTKTQYKIFHGGTLRGGHLNSEKPVGFCYPACMGLP